MPSKAARKTSRNSPEELRRRFLLSVYLRSQTMHLLGSAFPLRDLLVSPTIMPPPVQVNPDNIPISASQTHQQVPFLPEWPEFMAPYCVNPIKVSDILKGGKNVAIIGIPGSGKTFALAHFTSLLASQHPSIEYLQNALPVLLHARDLIEFPKHSQPLQQIMDICSRYSPEISSDAVQDIIEMSFKEQKVVLLVDGLDELPRTLIGEVYEIINSVLNTFPKIRVVVTGPIDFLDGFMESGFAVLPMSYWNQPTLQEFLRSFASAYFNRYNPEISSEELELAISGLLGWITQYPYARSPLEYTIQAVSILSGLESGQTSFDIINSYINQMVSVSATRSSLEVLAYQTIISENPVINKYEIDHYVPELVQSDPDSTPLPGSNNVRPSKALALVSKKVILQQTLRGNIFFTHPVFLGFLASNALIRNGQCAVIFNQPDWAPKEIALKYLAHLIDTTQYINMAELDNDAPLYRKLFSVAHWLGESKTGVIFRPQIMRRMAQIINSENQPFSIRAKAMAGIIFANVKNISGLFRQYLLNGSTIVKVLSAYACGILQDQNIFKELAGLLSDPDQHVRVAASSAIAKWDLPQAQDLTARILIQADEYMRRAVAEVLTLNTAEGIQTLLDGTNHNDLLVRRACTYGLGLIDRPWSRKQLQKLQTEDGQWVIRNTAAQALENLNGMDAHIPRLIAPPHAAPWLIAYATREGTGISPTASPLPLLFQVLSNGTDEEIVGALEYLSLFHEEGVIARLYDVIYSQQVTIREYAIYALWRLSLSGMELPPTKKYGFG